MTFPSGLITRMKVLDLFAGLKGWSDPFTERGHDVRTLELDSDFPGITYYADILDFAKDPDAWLEGWRPDAVLASPVCGGFSVMNIGRNWTRDHQPKTETARHGLAMLEATIQTIAFLKPRFFLIENPRAKMRKMPHMANLERRTVTYCQYGERRMKPTDLWGGFPPNLRLKAPCSNGGGCHVSAPRGSRTGTQGMDSAESAKIPRLLSLAVCEAMELDMQSRWSGAAIIPTSEPTMRQGTFL